MDQPANTAIGAAQRPGMLASKHLLPHAQRQQAYVLERRLRLLQQNGFGIFLAE